MSIKSNKKNEELLVYGYIRLNNKKNIQNIPIDLIKMCKLFYNNYLTWTISKEKFEEFYVNYKSKRFNDLYIYFDPDFPDFSVKYNNDNTDGKYLYGPIFAFRGFEFQSQITIRYEFNIEHIVLQLILKSLPNKFKNIFKNDRDSLMVYYEVNCENILPIVYEKMTVKMNRVGSSMIEWSTEYLAIKECKKLESISFGIYIDILNIKCSNNYKLNKYFKDNMIDSKFNVDWIMDNKILSEFKRYKNSLFFSPNYGLNGETDVDNFIWTFFIYKLRRIPIYGFNIVMLNMPSKVTEIVINYKIKSKIGSLYLSDKETITRNRNIIRIGNYEVENFTALYILNIQIEIINVKYKHKEINKYEWNQYGIY